MRFLERWYGLQEVFPIEVSREGKIRRFKLATIWGRKDTDTKQVSDRDFRTSVRMAEVSRGRLGIDVSLFFPRLFGR